MKPDAWPLKPEAWIFLLICALMAHLVVAYFLKRLKYRRVRKKFVEASEREDFQACAHWLTEAIRLYPEIGSLYLVRGGVFFELALWDRAVRDFSKFIQMRPDHSAGYSGRACAHLAMDIFELARVDFEQALRCNSNSLIACVNYAVLLTLCPLGHLRNGKKALYYAKHACELTEWKNAYALISLAAAHAELGDLAAAIEWCSKAIATAEPFSAKDKLKAIEWMQAIKDGKPFREAYWLRTGVKQEIVETSIKEAGI
jgi:tetratricopeptide (TPR) repeat protein